MQKVTACEAPVVPPTRTLYFSMTTMNEINQLMKGTRPNGSAPVRNPPANLGAVAERSLTASSAASFPGYGRSFFRPVLPISSKLEGRRTFPPSSRWSGTRTYVFEGVDRSPQTDDVAQTPRPSCDRRFQIPHLDYIDPAANLDPAV